MKFLQNQPGQRISEELQKTLRPGAELNMASSRFSLFAFSALAQELKQLRSTRLILPKFEAGAKAVDALQLQGDEADRQSRNQLQTRWLAKECAQWIKDKVEVRASQQPVAQNLSVVHHDSQPVTAILGSSPFTTEGLGLTPATQLHMNQCMEGPLESSMLDTWFHSIWGDSRSATDMKQQLLASLDELSRQRVPEQVYFATLFNLFQGMLGDIDEDKIIKSGTGIRNTCVWKKLYKFQRDGVLGAIDKLERHGGCIIADSVGLGKTFEALAVIKYYELRNDRVLVLAPKRLRDNWTIYTANDRRNSLADDRFNYDVLNHTDLSRDRGLSGDVDLSHLNWGNYDLVVIDESHNFRNKTTHRSSESRYHRLMNRVIKAGVRTNVLMLSATPVNNRLADLKNQLAFMTAGKDDALEPWGIPSIENTLRQAQGKFKIWQDLPERERRPAKLLEMLGFDYFKLLDLLTIARSRKHIAKYYGLDETGKFPQRLKPINIKSDLDSDGLFQSIREINNEIRKLKLSSYALLDYVLPHKMAAYEKKYRMEVRDGSSFFNQRDREKSLVTLIRINILKRMESSVSSFTLSLQRSLHDVEAILTKLDSHEESMEELDIADLDIDDSAFESLLLGNKVKVLLQDVDRIRWRQDLEEDRDRLVRLSRAAATITSKRDAKLIQLKELLGRKIQQPINPGNRKVIIFTAFADTAKYLYDNLSTWAKSNHGLNCALVTGSGGNKTTLNGLDSSLATILSAFSPRSKERSSDFANEGEIDFLIATDCISEGQNLQDCDYLINYDIHWNPVRIIQRFGRIDRIGSINQTIQLVNFWPNLELDEYIDLERRVSSRMVLLDVSATGEENLIEKEGGNEMNDLEYRRSQLKKLQETVLDLEDLGSGISITDLTLNDFRMDLAPYMKTRGEELAQLPLGLFTVTTPDGLGDDDISPGVIFCLRAVGPEAKKPLNPGYPLAPHYLVHVSESGAVELRFAQAKQILDRLKRLCQGKSQADLPAWSRFDSKTRQGRDMKPYQELLAKAIQAIAGKAEERGVESLFTPGGTHLLKGEFAGIQDFEAVAYLIILPAEAT